MSRKPIIALALGVALVVIGVLIVVLWPEDPSFQVKTSWLGERPSGPVRLCGSEDVTKARRRAVKDYNDKYFPGSTMATYSEGSFLADEEHDRYVRSVEEGSDDCDVILLDVVYMKEFAANHLLYDMTPYLDQHDRRADFDSDMLQTVEHEGRPWGVPKELDVGVLYYRADQVRPPRSWQDVYEQSKPGPSHDLPGLRVQVGPYEGLTVILLELAYAAGADPIITDDGKTAEIDQPHVREALKFLHDAFRERAIPQVPQIDTSNLEQYALGRARFLRGWPFVAAEIRNAEGGSEGKPSTPRAQRARRVTAANTTIVRLPPWTPGGDSVSVLGGRNLVVPRSAPHPSAALHLIDFMTSQEQVRQDVKEGSQLSVRKDLAEEFGFGNRDLLKAVNETNVMQRPSILQYADVSTIISCGVSNIIQGPAGIAIRERLQDIERDVQSVLDGGSSDLKSRAC